VRLIEREPECRRIAELLDRAAAGWGGVVVVEGEAGIGKTSLVDAVADIAQRDGVRCLRAQAGELEQELPFAIVRQLLEPVLRSGSPAFRAEILADAAGLAAPLFDLDPTGEATPEGTAAFVHGLYWVCSNLAEHGPLLIVVDDAHWCDEASLRFISHLARRIIDLRVLLVLATRAGGQTAALSRALTGTKPETLRLGPLSEAGVAGVVRAELGAEAGARFCHACADATGGNPFLLREAIIAVQAAGLAPLDEAAQRVRGLSSDSITNSVLDRVSRRGDPARRVAQAVAVLGPDADLHRVAALSDLPLQDAARIVDALQRDCLLVGDAPVRFIHPLVRSAVYGDHTAALRAADHKRVTAMLMAENHPVSRLIPHLLAAQRAHDPMIVKALIAAAEETMTAGSPEVAAQCLRRALSEPAPAELRGFIRARLGRALGFADQTGDAERELTTALRETDDAAARGDIALELGWLQLIVGRGGAATEVLAQAIADLADDSALSRRLRAMRASAGTMAFEDPSTWTSHVDPELLSAESFTLEQRLLIATSAVGGAMSGSLDSGTVARLALASADGDAPPRERWLITSFAGAALAISDHGDHAVALFARAQSISQAEGDVTTYRYLGMLRSHFCYYTGNLLEAEADARAALELASLEEAETSQIVLWPLLTVLAERGLLDEAEQLLVDHGLDGDLPSAGGYSAYTQVARGRLRRAQGKLDLALSDLTCVGEMFTAGGYLNPGFVPWRAEVAVTMVAMGQIRQAREIATEELRLARAFGARRAIGIALRALALTERGELRIALLSEAVQVLESSSARLEHARALVDLGSAMRADNSASESVAVLRNGLDLAARCSADALIERARTELVAAGARPRRYRRTGPRALTPSEYRVAMLASEGHTNRDIAQRLFVSRRTVELHLTNAFRKLGIESRQQLPDALSSAGP
jgi:DNA-binding CsgD family transcriptional regulator